MRRIHRWPTQELVNSIWATGRLLLVGSALVGAAADAALAKLGEHCARDLSNSAWRPAALAAQHQPLLSATASEAAVKLVSGDTQALSNTLRAPATSSACGAASAEAAAAETKRRSAEPTPQDVSILARCLTVLMAKEVPMLETLSACASRRLRQLDPQHPSNTARASAVLGSPGERLMGEIAAAVCQTGSPDPQNSANLVQDSATPGLGAAPFLASAASSANTLLPNSGPQEPANSARSLAKLRWADEAFFDASANEAAGKLAQSSVQDTTNILRAPGQLLPHQDSVFDAILAKVARDPWSFAAEPSAPMVLWASWKAGAFPRQLFHLWLEDLSAESFGLALMDTLWRKDAEEEQEVLRQLYRCFPVGPWQAPAARALPLGYRKVANLLETLQAVHGAEEILAACEDFARHKGQWLKVAGGHKAELLQAAQSGRPLAPAEVLVEFGAYVGYSAVRLSRQLRRNCLSLVSLEVNPVHVCISRRLLDLARVSWAEVKPGQAKDLVPQLMEELGERCAGLIFMDHRGTIFHQDLALLVRSRALAGQARLIADNTLNPGAPLFLWERFHSHCVTQSWALQEFLAHHEDWTTTSDWT
ncbi:unnamed protein product [Effrenium voratum]|uniref:Catechol O-methyltransferase n=1 Tax=Effrenium voratum TaxID=2562239 RepID=A0AA36HW35_9DINO|nr:unnamed protein product [Effrenium voratum]